MPVCPKTNKECSIASCGWMPCLEDDKLCQNLKKELSSPNKEIASEEDQEGTS